MDILIAGGTIITRRALNTLLNAVPNLEVVGEAANDDQLTTLYTQNAPDMVLFDGTLGDGSRGDAIQAIQISAPQTAVLVLCARPGQKEKMMTAGADAFVLKGDPPRTLLTAIETIRLQRENV